MATQQQWQLAWARAGEGPWPNAQRMIQLAPPFEGLRELCSLAEGGSGWTAESIGGEQILVIHALADGRFRHYQHEAVRAWGADIIICCHPAAVKARYPGLPICGDWEGPTLLNELDKGAYLAWCPEAGAEA